ncbi:MAG: histidine--tRNA ligase [Verrucomicrobiota bacterium]
MSFKSLPGFRDFYPTECQLREQIFQVWRQSAASFGFQQYDGPPLEPLDLFTKKSGEEIVGQLYNFTDKGEREIALRPEMTPTLARMAGARQRDYKKPMKWFAIPQLFRYERAQRGRLREHFQWNCDILGETGLGAESEIIALLIYSLSALGLTSDDVVVRISDRLFWKDFLDTNKVPEDKHYDFLQVLDKIERQDATTTQEKLGDLYGKVQAVFDGSAATESSRLTDLLGKLDAMGYGNWIQFDLSIVRGLAYYTGIVFEIHDRAGEFRAIAGGGRYDNLVKMIAGQDLPAVGFGMGDVVLGEILKDKQLFCGDGGCIDCYVVIADEEVRALALKFLQTLRASDLKVDYPLAPMKIGKQFQAAEDRGAELAIIVDQSLKDGRCQIKHLAKREQKEISFTEEQGKIAFQVPLKKIFS